MSISECLAVRLNVGRFCDCGGSIFNQYTELRRLLGKRKLERLASSGGCIGTRRQEGVHLLLSERKNYSEIIPATNQSFWRGI